MSSFPTVKGPRSVTLRSYSPTIISRTHSGRTLAQSVNAQRWMIDVEWPPLTRAQAHEILAFLAALGGQFGVFTFVPPNTKTPRGVGQAAIAGANIVVHETAAAGASIFWIKGWNNSVTNVLRKGDLIKLAGHAKAYMVTADLSSNGSGFSQIQITPPLMVAAAADEVVAVHDVPISCRLTADNPGVSADVAMFYGLTLSMEETW